MGEHPPSTAAITELASLSTVAYYVPAKPEREILRTNFLDALDELLEAGASAVVVEGEADYGKTTLLSQFCRRHPLSAFPLFLNPADSLSFEPALIRFDIANQIEWLLLGRELGYEDPEADAGLLRTKLYQLARESRRRKQRFIFVVDGLQHIATIRETVLDMLPLQTPGFAFLFSGAEHELALPISRAAVRSLRLTSFVPEETREFLLDCQVSTEQASELHKIARGIPGSIASVRRLLTAGVPADDILKKPFSRAPELFEKEWATLGTLTQSDYLVFGVLVFDTRTRALREIAAIAECATDDVRQLFSRATFVNVSTEDVPTITSESFRNFISDKLRQSRSHVIGRIIAYLQARPDDAIALRDLPQFLESLGRYEELLRYLSAERVGQVLRQSQALAPVRRYAQRAQNAAYRVGTAGDMFQTSLQRAAFLQLDTAGVGREEVQAHLGNLCTSRSNAVENAS